MWSKRLRNVFTGHLRRLRGCCAQNLVREGRKSQKELVQVRRLCEEPHEGHTGRDTWPGCGHPLPRLELHTSLVQLSKHFRAAQVFSWRSSRVPILIWGLGKLQAWRGESRGGGLSHTTLLKLLPQPLRARLKAAKRCSQRARGGIAEQLGVPGVTTAPWRDQRVGR